MLIKSATLENFTPNQGGKSGLRSQCRSCTNETNRATQKRNKEKWAPARREYWLQSHYGIGNADYENMLKEQNGKCKICKSVDPKRKGQIYFSVDHDHKTGKVRGLLCVTCNTLVGLLEGSCADTHIAFEALAYIRENDNGNRRMAGG
jgi:hypothetical protein